jgi:hypothetical protein
MRRSRTGAIQIRWPSAQVLPHLVCASPSCSIAESRARKAHTSFFPVHCT